MYQTSLDWPVLIFKISGKIIDLPNISKDSPFFTEIIRSNIYNRYKIILIPGGGRKVDKIREEYKKNEHNRKNGDNSETEFHRRNGDNSETELYRRNRDNNETELHRRSRENKVSEEIFHWKAIEIMDQNAALLFKSLSNSGKISKELLILTDSIERIKQSRMGIICFQPFKFLKENNELKESWSVTSDSISAYLAAKLGISHVSLIKDIDCLILPNKGRVNEILFDDLIKEMKSGGYIDSIKNHLGKGTIFPVDPEFPNICKKLCLSASILNGFNKSFISDIFKKMVEIKQPIKFDDLIGNEIRRVKNGLFMPKHKG